jgi:response regulator RpfG family c-di-GMP phosphodiesterase
MGMRQDEIRLLQKAAVLADIGKIEIAETILSKPGDLTARSGTRCVASGVGPPHTERDQPPRDAGESFAHHERFDGQGYRAAQGEEIPLGADSVIVTPTRR